MMCIFFSKIKGEGADSGEDSAGRRTTRKKARVDYSEAKGAQAAKG